MEKMNMHSISQTEANIAAIREKFPHCVTEHFDAEGNVNYAVDLDALKQEFSESIVEGMPERYMLSWPGKRESLLSANSPINKTIRPNHERSINFDATKNIFIEGNNLDALKLLQESYLGKVKLIYIDPPYNTGSDFIYEDNFSSTTEEYLLSSSQVDDSGGRLVANPDSNGRFHSDWLSMIYPRIKLARNLLSDDGVIFISIDDNEVHALKLLCSEIFGNENFIAQLAVQLNPRGRHLDKFIAKTHESILIFAKNALNDNVMHGLEKEGRMVDEYDKEDERGKFRALGLRNRNQAFNPITRPKLYFPLYVNPINKKVSLEKNENFIVELFPDAPDGTKTCWTWGKDKVLKDNSLLIAEKTGDDWRIYRKDYLIGDDGEFARTLPKSIWLDKEISNDYGRKVIKDLFGAAVMDFPKSVDLIKKIIEFSSSEGDIVLDFFAGSSTTAHAVLEQNIEDGLNRRFIMVQLDEDCDEKSIGYKNGFKKISDLSMERIRLAIESLKKDQGLLDAKVDMGFRAFNVDTSNMLDIYYNPDAISQDLLSDQADNVKLDRTPEDLLFQVLLDWGVDLSLPIQKETIEGKDVYLVDQNALAACFDSKGGVDEEFVKELAKKQPLRVVFRDAGFKSDSVKINVEQIFKLVSPSTEVKCI
jgi:adenine-specific DNA-methyltransferase